MSSSAVMSRRVHVLLRIAALAGCLAPTALAAGERAPSAPGFEGRVLVAHNAERTRLGMAPLRWSPQLSQEAQRWASTLARSGAFAHSHNRAGTGENLWMGTADWFTPEQMVGGFLSERRAFRPGRFPHVSATGNWADVGHYTQVIWPETQAVGCAVARGGRKDVMVCRYWPAGNVYGQPIG
ncbi:MAG: CAP domain-containing protein [Novosphingobium sp.]